MGAYVTKFDPESQVSIFGLSAQYTDTESATVAAIARTSFGADHHRISMVAVAGKIKNDYDDYLGTGMPLKSEDNIRAVLARYLYRFKGDWFVGGQFVVTNYHIVGQTALDDDVLNTLGLTGFESGGVGMAVLHDSRDIQDKPSKGWLLNFNNVAYRESIAGSNDFDVYRLDYRGFWTHGDGNVVAVRQSNQWTVDAPPGAYAPVLLRGYTMGEYLGQNMSSLEVEERYRLAERWTATFFAGVACLYGDGIDLRRLRQRLPECGARGAISAEAATRARGKSRICPGQRRQQCCDFQNGLCVVNPATDPARGRFVVARTGFQIFEQVITLTFR